MKKKWLTLVLVLVVQLMYSHVSAKDYNILDFGAEGDGTKKNTREIQAAIDTCSFNGGGRVIVPNGVFLTGTIILKQKVELFLESGATLLGSGDLADYIRTENKYYYPIHSLILAIEVSNIAITGLGTIDGNGLNGKDFRKGNNSGGRPNMINFFSCKNIRIHDVTLVNSARWMQNYVNCEYLQIRGIKVYNHGNFNNDGLDINGCREVVVSDCIIDSDDDGICLKSDGIGAVNKNITITNCVVSSHCNAIKLGQSSRGGFQNITVSNCVVRPSKSASYYNGIREGRTGLSVIMYDHGLNENIIFSDIVIDSVKTPIFLKIADSRRNDKPVGSMRNIQLNNIRATNAGFIPSSITGLPGNYLENVSLTNVDISSNGGGQLFDRSLNVPENAEGYPDNRIFQGNLPAFGLYLRHLKNFRMSNVRLGLEGADERSAIVFDDVVNASVDGLETTGSARDIPVIQFLRSSENRLQRVHQIGNVNNLISVLAESKNIALSLSDVSEVKVPVQVAKDIPAASVKMFSNYSFTHDSGIPSPQVFDASHETESVSRRQVYKGMPIQEVISAYWELGDYSRLIGIAGLDKWLNQEKEITIFAFNDSQIRQTPTHTLQKWQEGSDIQELKTFLNRFIVKGKVSAESLKNMKKIRSVSGNTISVRSEGGKLYVGDYVLLEQDIVAANGILHVLAPGAN